MTPPSPSIGPVIGSLHVALGGAVGAVLRYQLGRGMARWVGHQGVGHQALENQALAAFPWATLAANVIGSMAMGLLAGFLARYAPSGTMFGNEHIRLLLGVGLLGGFTTFSSFSLEMMMLIERGQLAQAIAYVLISVLAGVGALYIGLVMMRVSA